MKNPTLIATLFLIVAATARAQDAAAAPGPDLSGFIERSDKNQSQLLERSSEIIKRLAGIEGTLQSGATGAPGPTTAALEARLAELEAKLSAAPAPAAAPVSSEAVTLQTNINTMWIVVTAAMVFFMQAGFCMLELGLTRAKNAINICMKNFLDFCVGVLCFFFVGFGIMFGKDIAGWIGSGPFWLSDHIGTSGFWAFWFFQVAFAGTAATIISGAMAERTKFIGYLLYTAAITGFIYPFAGHWAWGSFGQGFGFGSGKGWLEAMGYIDFAGSSVVHAIGGSASLAGIIVVGARNGRFNADGSANLIAGHNLPMACLGTFILWFGWYGFNPGSTLIGDGSIGRIAVNTTIAPAAGAIAGMFGVWVHQGRPDLSMTLNGALGGLVGITANCHCVTPASAVAIGVVAGLIATFGGYALEKLRIDDAVGAVPVHLMCGVWGILAVALFHETGFSMERLKVQAIGIAAISGTSFVLSFIVFSVIDKVIGLRATEDEQDLGLDFTEHSGAAYPDFTTGENTLVLTK